MRQTTTSYKKFRETHNSFTNYSLTTSLEGNNADRIVFWMNNDDKKLRILDLETSNELEASGYYEISNSDEAIDKIKKINEKAYVQDDITKEPNNPILLSKAIVDKEKSDLVKELEELINKIATSPKEEAKNAYNEFKEIMSKINTQESKYSKLTTGQITCIKRVYEPLADFIYINKVDIKIITKAA